MKKTVFDKVVVGFVILVIAIFTALLFYTVGMTQTKITEQTKEEKMGEVNLIVDTLVKPYVEGKLDHSVFQSELGKAADSLDCGMWFANADELITVDTGFSRGAKGKLITDFIDEKYIYSDFIVTGDQNGFFSNDVLCTGVPVYNNSKYAGILIMHSSLDFIHEIASNTFASTYMPFLVLMVISLIALMLMTNSMLRPLRNIITTSKAYAAGNFNARCDATSLKNEFGELARSMENMADELNRSNEYRKKFISNISHDFRSPLTSIKGYIEAMLDGTIPPDRYEKYLNTVLSETKRLTKLTQGLIELKDFDSHDLQLDKSNFDLKSVIQPTINTFEGRCQDKGIYLHSVFHTDNTIVYADRMKIQQVIYNLVDNAIKFTPEGRQITITVTEKNAKIYTSVKDEGVGIPPEDQKKVFDRFFKTDPSRGKDKTGSGLGLSIIKEIIKAHGENITLTSKVDEGSEFIFSLPLRKEMQVPIKPVHTPVITPPPEETSKSSVLSNGKFKLKNLGK